MSDQTTIIDVDTSFGRLVVDHVIVSAPNQYNILEVNSHYEVFVDGVLKHKSNDPEDIMRALGHYIAGLSK